MCCTVASFAIQNECWSYGLFFFLHSVYAHHVSRYLKNQSVHVPKSTCSWYIVSTLHETPQDQTYKLISYVYVSLCSIVGTGTFIKFHSYTMLCAF